jgi:hypothetical protein
MNRKKIDKILLSLFAVCMLLFAVAYANPDPSGATLSPGNSSRGTNPSVASTNAQGGNTSQLNLNQSRITEIWQGFFGNVTGKITLQNSGGNTFYDWTPITIGGEVYATRTTVASWTSINCTNSTQWENEETSLSIPLNQTDGVNETYLVTTHPAITIGTTSLTGCRSTRPYNYTSTSSAFWNVLLNSDTTNVVYTTILKSGQNAFDNTTVAFELLVPTNKTTSTATYFFYVELD